MTIDATQILLDAIEPYRNPKHGKDRYNTPWRPDADGGGLSVSRDDAYGLGLKWYDHKEQRGGNGYTLARELGMELPREGEVTAAKKPVYDSLEHYASAHGVPLDALTAAGWREVKRRGQRAFSFVTAGGERYRYADEAAAGRKYDHATGWRACWYGLPEAVALATRTDQPLVLCNGEISTVAAQHHGVAACCVAGGERASIGPDLLDALTQAWQGPILVALDCDVPGRKAQEGLVKQLAGAGFDVKGVDLRGSHGFDLADFCYLHNGTSVQTLQQQVIVPQPERPIKASDLVLTPAPTGPIDVNDLMALERVPPRWFAPGFLREGFGMLVGQPNVGKTPLVIQLAIALATGGRWLESVRCAHCKVLFLGTEYTRQELIPIIDESLHGRSIPRDWLAFKTIDDDDIAPKTADEAIEKLDYFITAMGYEVIIIDVLTGFLPVEGFKQNVYRGDYTEFRPYHRLGLHRSAAILGTWHASKREADPRLMYNGSTGMWAVPASRMSMYTDQEQRVRLFSMPRFCEKKDWALTQYKDETGRSWVLSDATPEPAMPPTELQIFRFLKEHADKANPRSPATIAEMTALPAGTVKSALSRMFDKNIIQQAKVGRGYYVEEAATLATAATSATLATVATTSEHEAVATATSLQPEVSTQAPHQDARNGTSVAGLQELQRFIDAPAVATIFDRVPPSRRVVLRGYLRSNAENDQERARELCEEYGISYDEARKAVQ